jgi:hypothetical protein
MAWHGWLLAGGGWQQQLTQTSAWTWGPAATQRVPVGDSTRRASRKAAPRPARYSSGGRLSS